MAKHKPQQRPSAAPVKQTPAKQPTSNRPNVPVEPPPNWSALADKYAVPMLWGIVAVGFLLRTLNLDALSLWIDEFVHVTRAQNVVNGSGPLFTTDNNGILLTTILIPLFKILGESAWIARFPSVLFGLGSIWLTYRIATDLFGRYAGLISAFAASFSLYLVFWSRIARNYSIFLFFFLLLCFWFYRFWENQKREGGNFWEKNGLSLRYLGLSTLALLASLLSHQLSIFFVFSIAVYALSIAFGKILRNEGDAFSNKYFWLSCLGLPLLLITLIPGLNGILRAPLSLLLSPEQINWVLPQWGRLGELMKNQALESFGIYNGVLRYSPTILYFTGIAGLFAAFKLNRKSALWLLSMFLVPFFLQSFIFREPALPRYFIAAFPWFLIANAAFFVWFWNWLNRTLLQSAGNSTRYAFAALPFLFVLLSVRWTEMKRLVLAEQLEGHVVDRNVSSFNFTNWREPAEFVNKNRQSNDIIMSTVTSAASYYLKEKDVIWFRQNVYDTQRKQYVPMPSKAGNSAATLEDLQRTVQNTPRGWLLADYYMDNILVDDRARMFVFQNMRFYPEASKDGSVMLFGWDHSQPNPQQQNMVLQLGKAADKIISRDNIMNFPPEMAQSEIDMIVRTNGVGTDKEALVIFNGENAINLPVNKPGDGIETHRIPLQAGFLKPGRNVIQVAYDEELIKKDPNKGFTMYYLSFAPRGQ